MIKLLKRVLIVITLINLCWVSWVPAKSTDTSAMMITVPAGEYLSAPGRRKLFVDTYSIDTYELTNAEYSDFVKETAHRKPLFLDNADFNKPPQPVVGISWYDADAYCKWAGKRLATEAEWQKAAGWDAKKKVQYIYPWGDTYDMFRLNGLERRRGKTTIVGMFPSGKSPYGVFDMGGNVWEWIADIYKESPGKDGKVVKNFRHLLKGGSWGNKYDSDYARTYLECCALESDFRLSNVGTRCVR